MKRNLNFLIALVLLVCTFAFYPVITRVQAQALAVGDIVEFGGREWRLLDIDGGFGLILHEAVIATSPALAVGDDNNHVETGGNYANNKTRQRNF